MFPQLHPEDSTYGRLSVKARLCSLILCLSPISLFAQSTGLPVISDAALDPARDIASPRLESAMHRPLPEQYIWTREDAIPEKPDLKGSWTSEGNTHLEPHYFRRSFSIDAAPPAATLYLAGPGAATVYVNGERVAHFERNMETNIGAGVTAVDVTHALKAGKNVIAIEAVRGPEVGSSGNSRREVQLTAGRILAAKIVPAAEGNDAPPLVISDSQWKTAEKPVDGWQDAGFDDRGWEPADSLGGIESSMEFFQWNGDGGMYAWPGYDGISPFLAHFTLAPVALLHVYAGSGMLENLKSLTAADSAAEFTVSAGADSVSPSRLPQIMLDFGREVAGRLEIDSDSDQPADIDLQYGESEGEALNGPYLGMTPVHVPPHGTVYGPKNAFRYALLRFERGANVRFRSIQLDGIYYPVKYEGFFKSSDEKLNRMWMVGAYTAHLCMQDDIWDAPKRDRGRWMGDLDVSGRTIEDVFDDHFLMEETLDRLIGEAPITHHVNGIAGYSAFWITGETEYYLHTGSQQHLEKVHERLVQLLRYMETELDKRKLYTNTTKASPYVDWSPELEADTPEARMATQFEFYAGFRDGIYLLRELGDTQNADAFQKTADAMKAAAQKYLLDKSGSFGTRWQTNAYAVLSDIADPSEYAVIWRNALSSVGHVKYNALIITPYYNYYVISAMAKMGRRAEALDWIRQYWGGMIDEGATSFWEGYDPSWYKQDFHLSLQADDSTGYQTSLAHGWSSGVTPWIMEQILGIQPSGAGFSDVDVRPDLLDLAWAQGGEPTPRGMLKVDIRKDNGYKTTIDLPEGTVARVSLPVSSPGEPIWVNGAKQSGEAAEGGKRRIVTLKTAGHYELQSR
jgi:alpha-L-rhamnosidase